VCNVPNLDLHFITVGKHGDTAVGELDVIEALRNGSCDAGFVSKMMLDRRDTTLPGENNLDLEGVIHIPVFDHCQFDALSSLSKLKRDTFQSALFEMDMNNEDDRAVMIAEGIKERWMPTRESGYDSVRAAISKEDMSVSPAPYSMQKNPFKSLTIVT
jgi:ABC-type phosphate/phosphonate transport system substrate-binding protein